ncbi:MAG TPA: type III secretion system chaperone [Candidatus Avisuccinivibrio pullicola]|nr:type III secretion system chaperone [Candidatus Avisuccinivibrio pullicola]
MTPTDLQKLALRIAALNLNPFDDDHLSVTAKGGLILCLYYDAPAERLIIFAPLLKITQGEFSAALAARVLGLNAPRALKAGFRVGLISERLWLSVSLSANEDPEEAINRFSRVFAEVKGQILDGGSSEDETAAQDVTDGISQSLKEKALKASTGEDNLIKINELMRAAVWG